MPAKRVAYLKMASPDLGIHAVLVRADEPFPREAHVITSLALSVPMN
jgi:hypothetical protein